MRDNGAHKEGWRALLIIEEIDCILYRDVSKGVRRRGGEEEGTTTNNMFGFRSKVEKGRGFGAWNNNGSIFVLR